MAWFYGGLLTPHMSFINNASQFRSVSKHSYTSTSTEQKLLFASLLVRMRNANSNPQVGRPLPFKYYRRCPYSKAQAGFRRVVRVVDDSRSVAMFSKITAFFQQAAEVTSQVVSEKSTKCYGEL